MKNWRIIVFLPLLLCGPVFGENGNLQYRSDDNESERGTAVGRGEIRFRYGEILDAGISRREVAVQNADKLLPINFSNRIYAMIRIRLDDGRSISVHDFSLIHNYKGLNCVAIRSVSGTFDADRRIFPAFGDRLYDLLFILDIPDFNPAITYRCTLHYQLASTGMTDTDLKFKNFDQNELVFPAPTN